MSSVTHRGYTHLGLDVSKDSVSVAVLEADRDQAVIDRIFHDEASVRRLISRFPDRSKLWVCYEAGPTGYDLHRLLTSMGVRCDVVAPSLVPKGRGDHIKTDKRDARRLAGLHRAGELTPIGVPSPAQEGVRDLCRTRGDMVEDLTRARNRLTKFLLRHSRVWRDGSNWTYKHDQWLTNQHFDDRAMAATFGHYRAVITTREADLAAIDAELEPWCDREPFGHQVGRLSAYRGVSAIGGLCIAAEVFDWRRFARPRSFMAFTGLVPSEYSTGVSTHRGHITKAGNIHLRTHLIESAWAYQHHAAVGVRHRQRQEGLPPEVVARAWRAQTRLCARFRQLAARKNIRSVVAVAVARELAGFLWAEMTCDL